MSSNERLDGTAEEAAKKVISAAEKNLRAKARGIFNVIRHD